MKKIVKLAICIIVLVTSMFCFYTISYASELKSNGYVKIDIATDKTEYKTGDKINVNYSITNENIAPVVFLKDVVITTKATDKLKSMGIKETVQKANQLAFGYTLTNDKTTPVNNGRGVYSKIVNVSDIGNASITFEEINNQIGNRVSIQKSNIVGKVAVFVLALGLIIALVLLIIFRKLKKGAMTAMVLVFALFASLLYPGLNFKALAATNGATQKTFMASRQIMVDGVSQTFSVSVQVNAFYVNSNIKYYDDNKNSSVLTQNGNNAIPYNASPYDDLNKVMKYISNDKIKLGANLALGGSITYLSSVIGGVNSDTHNIVNNYDFGRQIQMSAYSGPVPYYVPGKELKPEWGTLGWNPIQAGDAYYHGSRILAFYQTSTFMYIKVRPNQWPLDDAPGECTFELTYNLIGNYADVKYRINMERVDWTDAQITQLALQTGKPEQWFRDNNNIKQYWATAIESPAVYTNGNWYKNVTYTGNKPFANEKLTETINFSPSQDSYPWTQFTCTENWMAFVTNDTNYGLGLYKADSTGFIAGFGGSKGGPDGYNDRGFSTGYMSAALSEIMDSNLAFDGNFTLILGTVEQIRSASYIFNGQKTNQLSYDFTNNSRSDWTYGSYWSSHISDKGYLNQDSLDFNFLPDGGFMKGPKTYFIPKEKKTIEIDATFSRNAEGAPELLATLQFALYSGIPSFVNASPQSAYSPVKFIADGQRRTYTLSLEDCYEYMSSPGCTNVRINFPSGSSDVHAKIYSIKLK